MILKITYFFVFLILFSCGNKMADDKEMRSIEELFTARLLDAQRLIKANNTEDFENIWNYYRNTTVNIENAKYSSTLHYIKSNYPELEDDYLSLRKNYGQLHELFVELKKSQNESNNAQQLKACKIMLEVTTEHHQKFLKRTQGRK